MSCSAPKRRRSAGAHSCRPPPCRAARRTHARGAAACRERAGARCEHGCACATGVSLPSRCAPALTPPPFRRRPRLRPLAAPCRAQGAARRGLPQLEPHRLQPLHPRGRALRTQGRREDCEGGASDWPRAPSPAPVTRAARCCASRWALPCRQPPPQPLPRPRSSADDGRSRAARCSPAAPHRRASGRGQDGRRGRALPRRALCARPAHPVRVGAHREEDSRRCARRERRCVRAAHAYALVSLSAAWPARARACTPGVRPRAARRANLVVRLPFARAGEKKLAVREEMQEALRNKVRLLHPPSPPGPPRLSACPPASAPPPSLHPSRIPHTARSRDAPAHSCPSALPSCALHRPQVAKYENAWQQLSLRYGTSRGKVFNEEEDRFLLCMTNKLSYGQVRCLRLRACGALFSSAPVPGSPTGRIPPFVRQPRVPCNCAVRGPWPGPQPSCPSVFPAAHALARPRPSLPL